MIEPILEKLVSVDVKTRGSKLVAMVPNWSHAPWFPLLLSATRVCFITAPIAINNPFTKLTDRPNAVSLRPS